MQNSVTQKLVPIFFYLLLGISVIFLAVFYYTTSGLNLPEKPTFQEEIDAYGTTLDLFVGWAYVLLGIAAAAAVIPSVVQLVTRPKNAIKSVISIVIVAVFVLIAYLLSDGTVLDLPGYTGGDNNPTTLKFADTMLFTMYFLLAGAIISIIYTEIAKAFK